MSTLRSKLCNTIYWYLWQYFVMLLLCQNFPTFPSQGKWLWPNRLLEVLDTCAKTLLRLLLQKLIIHYSDSRPLGQRILQIGYHTNTKFGPNWALRFGQTFTRSSLTLNMTRKLQESGKNIFSWTLDLIWPFFIEGDHISV